MSDLGSLLEPANLLHGWGVGEGEEEGHGDTGGEEGQAAFQETAQTNEAKVSQNRLKNITFFYF